MGSDITGFIYKTDNGVFAATREHECLLIPREFSIPRKSFTDYFVGVHAYEVDEKGVAQRTALRSERRIEVGDQIAPMPNGTSKLFFLADYRPSTYSLIQRIIELPLKELKQALEELERRKDAHYSEADEIHKMHEERLTRLREEKRRQHKPEPTLFDIIQ